MAIYPHLIKGGRDTDYRGQICYNNDFILTDIKRMYTIENWELNPIRGWQGHKIEKRWFASVNGSKELKEKLLSNILEYAVTHVAYYDGINPNTINNFPVIDKSEITSNYSTMFSAVYKDKKDSLRIMTTSGSSGTPFRIYQDHDKVLRNKADLLFFYKLGNYNVGDRIYFMRIWNEFNKKSKKQLFMENFRMFDTSNIDTEGAQYFLQSMTKDKKQKVILGYGSSYTSLMEYLPVDEKIDWKIKAIFSGAEELPQHVKKSMRRVFNCPVISRYSNQENGVLAQQPDTGQDYFELNSGSYYIEFLKIDSDEPADENEEARIVVTDLFNRAVPIIRYDTGDLGTYNYVEDEIRGKRRVLTKINGRKSDYLYSNQKKRLSPFTVINSMWKYTDVKQFQLIQEDYESVLLNIVYRNDENKDAIETKLEQEIKQIFGNTTKLTIKRLEKIPIDKSGKRKYIVSKIEKKMKTVQQFNE